jgi:hypothetical protein
MEKIILLQGIQRLVSLRLEKKLLDDNKQYNLFKTGNFQSGEISNDSFWNASLKDKSVLIDLSQLRWVEIGAALQLVLLIESVLKHGIQIEIALPNTKFREDEISFVEKDNQNEQLSIYGAVKGKRGLKVKRVT